MVWRTAGEKRFRALAHARVPALHYPVGALETKGSVAEALVMGWNP